MELRHLRYFVAAAEELNISRAANRLRISQPPLSRQIHDLEDEIGTALFDRSNRKVRLTAAGKYFLQEARRILSHAQHAARLAKAAAMGRGGQITIAFLSPLGGLFLPKVVRSFRKKFPLIDVDLMEMAPRQQLEALLDDQVDLAFVGQTEVDAFRMLAFEPVMGIGLRLALPREHKLAKLRNVPFTMLEPESFVIFKRSAAPGIHDFLVDLCRSAGFEPNVVKQSDRAQSLLDLVAAGVGVSIVPEPFARYQTDVLLRQLVPRPPKIRLCMVWRKTDKSPALHALRMIIRQHLPHCTG